MILMPMASQDFDPTEASILYKHLHEAGHKVIFATVDGHPARPDDRMMTGRGLGIWKGVLKARMDAVEACEMMMKDPAFQAPVKWNDIQSEDYAALALHGGHAPGMRPYLESSELMQTIRNFMNNQKPVGAICHGVVLMARATRSDGQSVLYGYRCTTLLKSQELAAHNMTRAWLKNYYRTYPGTTCQQEVTAALQSPDDFQSGPKPVLRDSPDKLSRGFIVRDRNLITARWPGDAYNYARGFLELLKES
ncbi:MAG: hypothetical protein CMN77_20385 [Spirochaetaceae bacterium]|nr:hypothetical protein [Spirochaetaceae bacterium]